jgi:hypothetical protein
VKVIAAVTLFRGNVKVKAPSLMRSLSEKTPEPKGKISCLHEFALKRSVERRSSGKILDAAMERGKP